MAYDSSPFTFSQLTSDDLDLRNAMTIPQHNTNLGWRSTLLCELADVIDDLLWSGFEPGRDGAGVRDRRRCNAFSFAVKTTHDGDEESSIIVVVDRGIKMSQFTAFSSWSG